MGKKSSGRAWNAVSKAPGNIISGAQLAASDPSAWLQKDGKSTAEAAQFVPGLGQAVSTGILAARAADQAGQGNLTGKALLDIVPGVATATDALKYATRNAGQQDNSLPTDPNASTLPTDPNVAQLMALRQRRLQYTGRQGTILSGGGSLGTGSNVLGS